MFYTKIPVINSMNESEISTDATFFFIIVFDYIRFGQIVLWTSIIL